LSRLLVGGEIVHPSGFLLGTHHWCNKQQRSSYFNSTHCVLFWTREEKL
jgi:hypothetical protein